jgi:hypothetical protein
MDGSSNNGVRHHAQSPGQAALILCESLMHFLVTKGVISREDFVDIIEGAAEVESELIGSGATAPADRNGSLLNPLASAFKRELDR